MSPTCEIEYSRQQFFEMMQFQLNLSNKMRPVKKRLISTTLTDGNSAISIKRLPIQPKKILKNRINMESLLPFKKRLFTIDFSELQSTKSERNKSKCIKKRTSSQAFNTNKENQNMEPKKRCYAAAIFETPVTRQRTRKLNESLVESNSPSVLNLSKTNDDRTSKLNSANDLDAEPSELKQRKQHRKNGQLQRKRKGSKNAKSPGIKQPHTPFGSNVASPVQKNEPLFESTEIAQQQQMLLPLFSNFDQWRSLFYQRTHELQTALILKN